MVTLIAVTRQRPSWGTQEEEEFTGIKGYEPEMTANMCV